MRISIIGPSNIEKFSKIVGLPRVQIERHAEQIGKVLAEGGHTVVVVFNYAGMLKLIGDAHKRHGGKLEMLYTKNDYDWFTDLYMHFLKEASVVVEKPSWHDLLLSLVTDSDIIICAGLSAGVYTEIGYMKWNFHEKKGAKKLIGIKEFLHGGQFPLELQYDTMQQMIDVVPAAELGAALRTLSS